MRENVLESAHLILKLFGLVIILDNGNTLETLPLGDLHEHFPERGISPVEHEGLGTLVKNHLLNAKGSERVNHTSRRAAQIDIILEH